jgi:hypothetical protein
MAGKRRVSLAYTIAERDGLFRWAYLECYAADPVFGRDLVALYAEHAARLVPLPFDPATWWRAAASDREAVRRLRGIADPVPILAYREAVRALCGRYGLDRLRPPAQWLFPGVDVGEHVVHAWCWWRASEAAAGRDVGPDQFLTGYGVSSMVPDIGGGIWDPRRETRAAARARLGWRRAPDLETLAERGDEEGLVWLDEFPELERDIGWLYSHVAHGKAYRDIAASYFHDAHPTPTQADTVGRAVRQMAARVLRSDHKGR